ncbi:MAG: macro domain-containing protein, partial [Anaerolineaceae bacterium]|nr:macro domain-containing protein [Anaerolineaceae bacterium]
AIGFCDFGKAVITPGFNLPVKAVIHTVGPVWRGGNQGEEELLRSAYRSSLELAKQNGFESIAFPLISSGNFGFPYESAFAIALDEINRFLLEDDLDVTLVVFDNTATAIAKFRNKDLLTYINDHYVDEHLDTNRPNYIRDLPHPFMVHAYPMSRKELSDIEAKFDFPEEVTFSDALLAFVDAKGMTDPEVYKRSNIDRKHFSKIRSDKYYNPKKTTVLALAIGLKLNLKESKDLLARAGYAFSPCDKRDVIVKYFIERGEFDIMKVNGALFDFDQKLLGY